MPGQFSKLKRPPAYRVLAEKISEQILEGSLSIGELLPVETDLAEQFGVNRSTVRESIRLLEEQGLVRRAAAKRLIVTKPSYDNLGTQMNRALVMHGISYRELWEVYIAIEPSAAEYAAKNHRPEHLMMLRENVQQTKLALEKELPLALLDFEYHSIICEATDNKALKLIREPLSMLFQAAIVRVLESTPVAGQRMYQAHKTILEAIISGDGQAAYKWMHRHISDFKRGYENLNLGRQSIVRFSDSDIKL